MNNWEAFLFFKQFLEKADMSEETRKFIEQGEKRREEGDLKKGKNDKNLTGLLDDIKI